MGADECLSGLVHAIQVEGAIPVQDQLPGERIRAVGAVTDSVGIATPDCAETRIESLGGGLEIPDADICGEGTVDAGSVDFGVIDRDVEVDDLTAGMDTRIGTTGTGGLHFSAEEVRENALNFTLHGAQGALRGPAGEVSAVVGDHRAQTTQPATIGGGL